MRYKPRFNFGDGDSKKQICMRLQFKPMFNQVRWEGVLIEISKQKDRSACCGGGIPVFRSILQIYKPTTPEYTAHGVVPTCIEKQSTYDRLAKIILDRK